MAESASCGCECDVLLVARLDCAVVVVVVVVVVGGGAVGGRALRGAGGATVSLSISDAAYDATKGLPAPLSTFLFLDEEEEEDASPPMVMLLKSVGLVASSTTYPLPLGLISPSGYCCYCYG